MERSAGPNLRHRLQKFIGKSGVKLELVSRHVHDHNADGQVLEIVFVFKSTINGDEYIERLRDLADQQVVLGLMTAHLESRLHVVTFEDTSRTRIDAGV